MNGDPFAGDTGGRETASAFSVLALALVLAGCGSTSPASPGAATATLSATVPSPTPMAMTRPSAPTVGWAYTFPDPSVSLWPDEPVFASDGTIFVSDGEIVALDTSGRMRPGWPAPYMGNNWLRVGPDGSVYTADCGEPGQPCGLHRFGSDGDEPPGWPYDPGCEIADFSVGGDGTAYVACYWRYPEGTVSIVALDEAGKERPGWPLGARTFRNWTSGYELLADPDPSREPTLFVLDRQNPTLTALDPVGHTRAGWPARITGSRPNLILARDGTPVVVSYVGDPVTRTVFTMIGPDGGIQPGWPRKARGEVSDITVALDGTLYYVARPGTVYAHDRTGSVKPGWPVAIPGADRLGCDFETSACLAVGPDGTVYLMGLSEDDSEMLVALDPNGRVLSGWPYVWRDRVVVNVSPPQVSSYNGYAPGRRELGLANDGTVYVAVAGPDGVEIVALDRSGNVKPGWPYVPRCSPGPYRPEVTFIKAMTVGSGDRLYAFVTAHDPDVIFNMGPMRTTLVVIPPDGRVSE